MVNSPIPTDLAGECKKAAKTLNNFIDPVAAKGPDKVIPSNILQKAKGFAIFTVIKAGFLFSGRLGSGLVVARLEDGSWSAPSAINIVGMGAGGQIGAELTDFVMVLNSKDAVKSFMHGGNVTLGGNLSVAAGPIGRTAEGAGSVSLGNVAAIFSYSKTKGLFAGVSIEGSVIAERRDANSKFYHSRVTAKELLLGKIPPPPQADILYRALNAKASRTNYGDTQYNEEPVYGEEYEAPKSPKSSRSVSLSTSSSSRSNTHKNRSSSLSSYKNKNNDNKDHSDEDDDSYSKVVSSIKKKPNYYESATKASSLASSNEINDEISKRISSGSSLNRKSLSKPPPIAPKPNIPPRKKQQTAVALYDFDGEQEGDLSFRKGDIIVITKHSESTNDWWTGRCSGKEGIFPANYVELN